MKGWQGEDQLRAEIAEAFELGAGRPARAHQLDAVTQLLLALRSDCLEPDTAAHAAPEQAAAGSSASRPHALRSPPVNYLIQHSTGSGKSLTIASLVAALVDWQDALGALFHTVIIVTDRLQLDRQLGDTVTAFLAAQGMPFHLVRRASSTHELSAFLRDPPGSETRPKVVLTTMQKLATLWQKDAATARSRPAGPAPAGPALGSYAEAGGGGDAALLDAWLVGGRVAIVADEAHRHHGLSTTDLINRVLTAGGSEGAGPAAAGHHPAVKAAQPRRLTYIGFTATPGPRALELFGVASRLSCDALGAVLSSSEDEGEGGDGDEAGGELGAEKADGGRRASITAYCPFHVYSMQQAIADGHILDVLQNYTTISPHVTIAGVDPGAAAAATAAAPGGASSAPPCDEMALVEAAYKSRELVRQKVAYLLPRFLDNWKRASQAGFHELRAMVVTSSRQQVVWYVQELRAALQRSAEFQQLQRDAQLARSREPAPAAADGARDAQGPAVYGAFSGSVSVAEEELRLLKQLLREDEQQPEQQTQQQQRLAGEGGKRGRGGAGRRSSSSSRSRPNPWDLALAHLEAPAAAGPLAGCGGREGEGEGMVEGERECGSSEGSDGEQSSSTAVSSGEDWEEEEVGRRGRQGKGEANRAGRHEHSHSGSGDGVSSGGLGCCSGREDEGSDGPASRRSSGSSRPFKRLRSCSSLSSIAAPPPAAAAGRTRSHRQPQPQLQRAAAAADGAGARVGLTERELNGGANGGPGAARFLVVCNKFETGYDDPRLGALFLDRAVSGAKAVQVLGRLNRPAPQLGKSAALIQVVDFCNSVGALRESFEEYLAATTLHTGRHARRLRLELRMDHCVSRLLEALQGAAARAFPAPAASLPMLSPKQIVFAVSRLPLESRTSLRADLKVYTESATELRREKPELPLAFALELLNQLSQMQSTRQAAGRAGEEDREDGDSGEGEPRPDLEVQVQACALEETYHGPIHFASEGGGLRPLSSRRLPGPRGARKGGSRGGREGGGAASAGGGRSAGSKAGSTWRGAAAKKALQNRPLAEVIAAANAELTSRYERRALAGLREICGRLRATWQGAEPAAAPAEARAARAPPAAGRGQEGDHYLLLSLLRRLMMWPVTKELLQATQAGRIVSQLRRHPDALVSALAGQVTRQWKSALNAAADQTAAAAAAAAAAALNQAAKETAAPPGGQISAAAAAPAAAGRDGALRAKARAMLAEALKSLPRSEAAQQLAADLEAALFKALNRDTGITYRARLRTLVPALKLSDGVGRELLDGELEPGEVAGMPPRFLLPAAARKELEEKERLKKEREDAQDRAGMCVESVTCPRCKGGSVKGQMVMSGGTYAQERVQVQKFLCTDCDHTWKDE